MSLTQECVVIYGEGGERDKEEDAYLAVMVTLKTCKVAKS